MALSMVDIGDSRVISDFRVKEEMKRHLQDLGFAKGATVKVLGDNPSGLILLVKGSRIALSKGLASKIMVH